MAPGPIHSIIHQDCLLDDQGTLQPEAHRTSGYSGITPPTTSPVFNRSTAASTTFDHRSRRHSLKQGLIRQHVDLVLQERHHDQHAGALASLRDGMLREGTFSPEPYFMSHPIGRCEQANDRVTGAEPGSCAIGQDCRQYQPGRIGRMPAPGKPE